MLTPEQRAVPLDLDAIKRRCQCAYQEVFAICKGRHREGGKDWRMSIPVQKDDSDIVICDALRDIEALTAALEARAAERPAAGEVKEWML